MRHSEFWRLADAVFGEAYARRLGREIALTALDSRTPEEALNAGLPPRDVWHAWCDEMQVPQERRDGGVRELLVPPRRR